MFCGGEGRLVGIDKGQLVGELLMVAREKPSDEV